MAMSQPEDVEIAAKARVRELVYRSIRIQVMLLTLFGAAAICGILNWPQLPDLDVEARTRVVVSLLFAFAFGSTNLMMLLYRDDEEIRFLLDKIVPEASPEEICPADSSRGFFLKVAVRILRNSKNRRKG
jgi:hypothetical protein